MSLDLSRCEIRALELSAQGYYAREIGEIVGRTRRTIETQLASARRKLGARTIAQALVICIRQGLILPLAERREQSGALDG